MLNTRVTGDRVRNHLRYDWWKYALPIVLLLIFWDAAYQVTAYHPPADKRIEIHLVGYYTTTDLSDMLCADLLAALPDDQEEVTVISDEISFNGQETITDMSGLQRLQARLIVKQGNVFIMPRNVYNQFAAQGVFLSLESYLQDGTFVAEGNPEDLAVQLVESDDSGQWVPVGEASIYALSITHVKGLEKYLGYDPKGADLVIAIPYYAVNMDNTIRTVQWLMSLK